MTTMTKPRHNIQIRVTPAIYAAIKDHAEREGLSLSRWIQESLLLRIGYENGLDHTPEDQEQAREVVLDVFDDYL